METTEEMKLDNELHAISNLQLHLSDNGGNHKRYAAEVRLVAARDKRDVEIITMHSQDAARDKNS